MISSAILSKLTSTLASTDVGDRIFPVMAEENTALPFTIYTCKLKESVWTNAGPSGTYKWDVVVDIFGINFSDCTGIARTLRTAMDGWSDNENDIWQCGLDSAEPVITEITNGFGYEMVFQVWEK